MTVNSSRLRKSFGNVTGKSKKTAVIFAGPRMGGGREERRTSRATPMGRIQVTRAAVRDKYFGHLANIIENNTYRVRKLRDPRRIARGDKGILHIPGFTGGQNPPHSIFKHSGVFRARPFVDKTYRLQTKPFLKETLNQSKILIEKVKA